MADYFRLTTGVQMDNECQLINVAAWLWETEELIQTEMQAIGWERAVEDLATRGVGVWRWAAEPVSVGKQT